jgi:hypothetical protein
MKTEAFGSERREKIATDLATTIISKVSKELQQWVTFKSFKPDLVKILIQHIELPQSEGVFDPDRRDTLREAAGEDDDPRGAPKMLRKLTVVKVQKVGVMRVFVYKSKSSWSLPFVTVVQGSDGSELPGSSGSTADEAIKNTTKLLKRAGAEIREGEDEDEGGVSYSDKKLGVELHNWHSGQDDPIYQVGSLIFARKPVPNDLVDDAIGSLESLARKSKSRKEKAELKRLVTALKRAE